MSYDYIDDYCEVSNNEQEITIKLIEIPISGTLTPQYKKVYDSCDNERCVFNASPECYLFKKYLSNKPNNPSK